MTRVPVKRLILALIFSIAPWGSVAFSQEVIVLGGIDEVISWLEAEDWWGEENRDEQLEVPHTMLTGINPSWRDAAQELTVPEKKEIFYRFMLPLALHANMMVLERREELLGFQEQVAAGEPIAEASMDDLRAAAVLLRIRNLDDAANLTPSSRDLAEVVEEALYKLDVIPSGLVLGQAAYESGYGTSRFTIEGNALFGQWAFGGEGLVPEQQRESLGDHRIAAFDWPFDSVRGYFLNLMSHPAYEEFRRIRAELKAAGEPLSSLALADGLTSYSERGQEYVDTLKSMIRVNRLEIADDAVFRDEPIRFVVGAEDPAAAELLREEVEVLRASGDLALIIERMRLE